MTYLATKEFSDRTPVLTECITGVYIPDHGETAEVAKRRYLYMQFGGTHSRQQRSCRDPCQPRRPEKSKKVAASLLGITD